MPAHTVTHDDSVHTGMAFDPRSITGIKGWYEADSITGIAPAGTLTTWFDISGNALDLTQGTSGQRPTYQTLAANGRPVVRFDGTNDALTSAAFTWGNQLTTFSVVNASSLTGTRAPIGFGSGGDMYIQMYSSTVAFNFFGDIFQTTAAPSTSTWYILSHTADGSLSGATPHESTGWVNNVSAGTWTDHNSVIPLGSQTITVGSVFPDGTQAFQGDIAEVIVYNALLTTTQRQRVQSYLAAKYGITLA